MGLIVGDICLLTSAPTKLLSTQEAMFNQAADNVSNEKLNKLPGNKIPTLEF